jgi:hypothetical protein
MLQTTPISGSAPAPADLSSPAAPSLRPAALRAEDGIASSPRAGPARISSGRGTRAGTVSRAATAGYSTAASAKGDFSFLRDPKLTLEQKLMRFMATMAKKLDEDIQRRMEELAPKDAKKTSSSSSKSSSSKKKGGILGKALSAVLKSKPMKDFLKQVTGPVLAAGAAALGFPALSAVLLKAGPSIGQVLGGLVGSLDLTSLDLGGSTSSSASSGGTGASSASSASSSSSSSSGASGMGATEERIKMMELQQLLEKQKEMFTLVSNMLKTFHDMRMASVNNIR